MDILYTNTHAAAKLVPIDASIMVVVYMYTNMLQISCMTILNIVNTWYTKVQYQPCFPCMALDALAWTTIDPIWAHTHLQIYILYTQCACQAGHTVWSAVHQYIHVPYIHRSPATSTHLQRLQHGQFCDNSDICLGIWKLHVRAYNELEH